jgi:hypothetical protein
MLLKNFAKERDGRVAQDDESRNLFNSPRSK